MGARVSPETDRTACLRGQGKQGGWEGPLTPHKDWVPGLFSLRLHKQKLLPALSPTANMADTPMLQKD